MATYTEPDTTSKKIEKVKPMLPFIVGGASVLFMALKGLRRGNGGDFKRHSHSALEHVHEHVHVTHYRNDSDKGVGGWDHLTAEHRHAHNHPAVDHAHRPHRDFDKEHRSEAHVHDHEHPLGE